MGDLLMVPSFERSWIKADGPQIFVSTCELSRMCHTNVLPLLKDRMVQATIDQVKDMAHDYHRGENDYHDLTREGMTLSNACT